MSIGIMYFGCIWAIDLIEDPGAVQNLVRAEACGKFELAENPGGLKVLRSSLIHSQWGTD